MYRIYAYLHEHEHIESSIHNDSGLFRHVKIWHRLRA